jgi:hypothetical protein
VCPRSLPLTDDRSKPPLPLCPSLVFARLAPANERGDDRAQAEQRGVHQEVGLCLPRPQNRRNDHPHPEHHLECHPEAAVPPFRAGLTHCAERSTCSSLGLRQQISARPSTTHQPSCRSRVRSDVRRLRCRSASPPTTKSTRFAARVIRSWSRAEPARTRASGRTAAAARSAQGPRFLLSPLARAAPARRTTAAGAATRTPGTSAVRHRCRRFGSVELSPHATERAKSTAEDAVDHAADPHFPALAPCKVLPRYEGSLSSVAGV